MDNSVIGTYKSFFARKYLWLFLSRIMPLAALFLITIIYSRKLSYNDYGTFQSVWMYANIINVMISFGFSSIILSTNLNFFFKFIKDNQVTVISFYTIISIAGLTLFFFFAKNFDTTLKFLLITFMIIQNIITVFETLLIKRHKEKDSCIINIFYSLFFLACHLYILLNNYSLSKLIIGLCILSVLKLISILLIPAPKAISEIKENENNFLNHWAYLGFNEILGVISRWIDKVFLLYLLTAADFAIFFNGSFEIPLFGLLISVAGSFMLIEFSKNIQLKEKMISMFNESSSMLSSIVFPLFFFLLFFREELFSLIFKNRYNDSVPIFAISIFILPLRINNYSVILQCYSQGKKIMIGSLLDIIIALFLMIILYPFLKSKGIVLSIVISTYCQVIYYLWHSAKILNVKIYELLPFKKLFIKFLILLVVYGIVFLLLKKTSIITRLIVATIFTAIFIITGMWSYLKTFFNKNYEQIS